MRVQPRDQLAVSAKLGSYAFRRCPGEGHGVNEGLNEDSGLLLSVKHIAVRRNY